MHCGLYGAFCCFCLASSFLPNCTGQIIFFIFIFGLITVKNQLSLTQWRQARTRKTIQQKSSLFTHKFLMDNYEVVSLCEVPFFVPWEKSWIYVTGQVNEPCAHASLVTC